MFHMDEFVTVNSKSELIRLPRLLKKMRYKESIFALDRALPLFRFHKVTKTL